MIDNIKIENFQSHKNTELKLSSGINVLVGPSDNGKTAVLRSLFWVILNNPAGTAHVSDWIKEKTKKGNLKILGDTKVTIKKDKQEISRLRNNDTNAYIVNGETLEAVRTDVPEEIKDIINIDDVNIQQQMDAPFLLSESGSEVARFFNKLVKLDIIDQYLSSIDSKKRETQKTLKFEENELKELNNKLSNYDWLEKVKNLLKRYELIDNSRKEKIENSIILQKEIEHHIMWIDEIKICNKAIEAQSLLKKYETQKSNLASKIDTKENLILQIRKYQGFTSVIESRSMIDKTAIQITKYKTFAKRKEDNEIIKKTLLNQIDQYKKLNKEIKQLSEIKNVSGLLNQARELTKRINKNKTISKELQSDICIYNGQSELLKNMIFRISDLQKSIPEVCPTCGQSLKGKVNV